MEQNNNGFIELYGIDVNKYVQEKNGLKYLSWSYAWAEVKKHYPEASYTIKRFDGKPYLFDESLGYMVFTEMTIEGHTHEMWLPVMDGANKAMKKEPYTYEVKKYVWDQAQRKKVWFGEYEDKAVEAATMFDINTAIMRCLTKNIAMFGLGLYIYAGEDLPVGAEETPKQEPKKEPKQEAKPVSQYKPEDTNWQPPQPPVIAPKTPLYICSQCGVEIESRVKDYSERIYGRALCRDCQKQATKATETPKVANSYNPLVKEDLPF